MSQEITLPPLPPLPTAEFPGVAVRGHGNIPRYLFTADQMQSHARAAADSALESIGQQIKDLLGNPINVHTNMCRGLIAPITFDMLAHILGDEATATWISGRQQHGEPVGEVFTMELLDGSGEVRPHALLTRPLPAGTKLYTAPPPSQASMTVPSDDLSTLQSLLSWAEAQICLHEETHRGGAIWEICDQCGAKWADDEGGKPEFQWPQPIVKARALLSSYTPTASNTEPAADRIDWNEISRRGLLKRINQEIMHPLGLAVYRDTDTGASGGALVSPDGAFHYADDAQAQPNAQDRENAARCWCETCRPITMSDSRMILCPECGDKRCPRAKDHRNACAVARAPKGK